MERASFKVSVLCRYAVPALALIFMMGSLANSGRLSPELSNSLYIAGHRVVRTLLIYEPISREGDRSILGRPKSIFQDRNGRHWISTIAHLFTYESEEPEIELAKFRSAQAPTEESVIPETKSGIVWGFSEIDRNIECISPENCSLGGGVASPLPNATIYAFPGLNGTIWAVTDNGLRYYDGARWTRRFSLSDREEEKIARMRDPTEPNLRLNPKTLDRLSPRTLEILRKLKGRPFDSVETGLQDREGNVWLACHRAILRLDPVKGAWTIFPVWEPLNIVVKIYEDRSNRIWFGDNRGCIAACDATTSKQTSYFLSDPFAAAERDQALPPSVSPLTITSIYQDKHRLMMFGTWRGLFTFDERTKLTVRSEICRTVMRLTSEYEKYTPER